MPKLPTYTAELGDLPITGRRADAGDFGAAIGVGLGTLGKAGKDLHTDIEDSEMRKALVRTSEIRAKYAQLLDEAAQAGKDVGELKQAMNDELSQVGDGFSTPKGYDQLAIYAANTNQMFDQQANAITVHRAGADAKIDATNFVNSAAELLNKSPSYLPTALADADRFVDTLTRVSPEDRAEIKQKLKLELNMSAALASARIMPEETKTKLENGAWELTPDARKEVIGTADMTIRAKRAEEQYKHELLKEQRIETSEQARDELYKGLRKGTVREGDIMNDARLLPHTREHLINAMEQMAREKREGMERSNPVTKRDLFLRIHASADDPRKIRTADEVLVALERGLLNTQDAEHLQEMIAEQKDPNNQTLGSRLASATQIIGTALSQDPHFIQQPALVAEIQMDYAASVRERMANLRKAKKEPAEVFDPHSPQYVGSQQYIQQSIDRSKNRMMQSATPAGTAIDLTKTPDKAKDIKAGDVFVDPNGVQRKATQKLVDDLKKQPYGNAGNKREATGKIRQGN